MVLASDVAAAGFFVDGRLVLGAVAEFEFISFGASGEAHDLRAEADAEDWFVHGEGFFDDGVKFGEHCGIARAIGHEDAVVFEAGGDEVVVPWNANDGEVAGEEVAHDVVLHAAIDGDDGFFAFFVGLDFFW